MTNSWLLGAGAPDRTIRRIIGHSSKAEKRVMTDNYDARIIDVHGAVERLPAQPIQAAATRKVRVAG